MKKLKLKPSQRSLKNSQQENHNTNHEIPHHGMLATALAALGVVYGDIGTSPLYAMKECFYGPHGLPVNEVTVLGVLSIIFWSFTIMISVKYMMFVLRADNNGEGGILSLMALACPVELREKKFILVTLGLFGAALLYGDGIITPAISVLSAVEGLNIATPILEPYVDVITVVILLLLFLMQKWGTEKIGFIFGPVMLIWFIVIGSMGLKEVISHPYVLNSINPYYAYHFFEQYKMEGFFVLSMVFLVMTGAEALYADMGHFGKSPIRFAWFGLAMPALVLNYFGQGSLLIANPKAAENPFYFLAPEWGLLPLVVLATGATVIASQALISGVFSLSSQAIQLGYLPRLSIIHTSSEHRGQIYMPQINWALCASTVWLVLEFKSSSSLAAAYGLSVSLTMLITSILFADVARRVWKWPSIAAFTVGIVFMILDSSFLIANISKIKDGGWLPLAIGIIMYTLLATWKKGKRILGKRLRKSSPLLKEFINDAIQTAFARVPGTAVFMVGDPQTTPPALVHNFKHNRILHTKTVILSVITRDIPYIEETQRLHVETLVDGIYKVTGQYGFMEIPDIPELLTLCKNKDIHFSISETTFFLGRETIIASDHPGMALWREGLFSAMSKNAQRATDFFNIPPDQVIEVGMQVEI